MTDLQIKNNIKFRINSDGKVVIGDAPQSWPGTYKLYVETGILTEQIRVALKNSSYWADYVLSNGYKLKPLNEVKTFIEQNGHLPEVPSSQELTKQGLDLGEMQSIQMKKIEELTLYIIELNQKIADLEKQVQKIQQK